MTEQWKCPECGSTETKGRIKGLCKPCYNRAWREANRERFAATQRAWREANKERFTAAMRAWREANREKHRATKRAWREANKKRVAGYRRDWRRKLKWEVIEKLGGVCACCGEARLEFLTVDHVRGDGAEHRRHVGSGGSSQRVHAAIKREGYPRDKYRVLCINCNFSIGVWGYCPHQTVRKTEYPDSKEGGA